MSAWDPPHPLPQRVQQRHPLWRHLDFTPFSYTQDYISISLRVCFKLIRTVPFKHLQSRVSVAGMNPMLLNAQLQALNPLLYGSQFNPGLLQMQQAAATAERLRAMASSSSSGSQRYSPYPLPSPPASSSLSLGSPTSSSASSAFQAVKKSNLHEVGSSSKSETDKNSTRGSPDPREPNEDEKESKSEDMDESPVSTSDIKSMEKLVNGLNGSSASKFGISHNNNDQQIST